MSSHHPETLVKYCSADTAEKILETQTLRWSAPYLYGDPFELDHTTPLNFDSQSLQQAAIQTAAGHIFAREAPRGGTPLMAAIRRWREEERFASPEEAEEVLKDLLGQMVEQRGEAVEQILSDWQGFTRQLRVCCFTAKPDNLSAWSQFADSHRGVAMRFQCGQGTSLGRPMKVQYKTMRPEITTLKEQLGVIMNNERFVAQEHFYDKVTSKPAHNREENEWRCFRQNKGEQQPQNDDPSQWFDNIKFERADLSAVYFGIQCSKQHMREIYDLVKAQYPQAKLFQAKTLSGKYEIEFERLRNR